MVTYRCEPYVYAQMIAVRDSATPGEAKNSWLTGTAAWTLVAATQGILGIQPDYSALVVDPCVPRDWPGFRVVREFRGATYDITITNPRGHSKGILSLNVDGKKISGNAIPLTAPAGTTVIVQGEIA